MFSDGCIMTRLHNLSDRPANFPTLDTLPIERRPLGYSDAYDSQGDTNSHRNLRINPIVETAIANTASMMTSQPVPLAMATTWEAQHPTVRREYACLLF